MELHTPPDPPTQRYLSWDQTIERGKQSNHRRIKKQSEIHVRKLSALGGTGEGQIMRESGGGDEIWTSDT